ncbi:DUF2332 domain-containing protein [Paucibacter sp. APW11]|uniref:DUF2332 domain-containing protein n=1 Tax=Roseateles aquae TaxID=3077235 RepID=A0ABU3PH46_9BURK|nr:DUF2332 domain-containing protein [Paucibacter sp. APW11]MDT9001870.1 DUF2332 domain-containing protein [Paucibacter sp. APW11]
MEHLHSPDITALIDTQRQAYLHFATHECIDDPLYVAICCAIAAEPSLLALMRHAPVRQAKPNLLLAALHERVLAGSSHAFASYYPSVRGTRLPDAELPALLLDFARLHEARLIEHLQTRATQTNEAGRSAILWPALQAVAERTGRSRLSLFDFGASGGLNLGVDRYRYEYQRDDGIAMRGAAAAEGVPTIACRWQGWLPEQAQCQLVERCGVDLSPVDLGDEDALRWLLACLWPHDLARAERLKQAAALVRDGGWTVERSQQGLDRLEAWLDTLEPGVQPLLFNSWVLYYFQPEERAAHQTRVARLVRERGLAWLSAEAAGSRPPEVQEPPPCELSGTSTGTLWTLQWRDADAQLRSEALAWSHPHGRWGQWLL